MTSGSYVYVYLMEYIWKTEQVCEQASKTVNDDPATEGRVLAEEVEEEQGEKCKFILQCRRCHQHCVVLESISCGSIFIFLCFYTHYHTLTYTKLKENKN